MTRAWESRVMWTRGIRKRWNSRRRTALRFRCFRSGRPYLPSSAQHPKCLEVDRGGNMYVILGASGHTGRIVAETLLDGGHKVRVVGRSKQRLEGFTVLGADIFEANVKDSVALTKACTGPKAVYALVPPNLASTDYRAEQDVVTESLAKALEAAGVG